MNSVRVVSSFETSPAGTDSSLPASRAGKPIMESAAGKTSA